MSVRRRRVPPVREFPEGWVVEREVKLPGKAVLSRGSKFKAQGLPGDCKFRHFVTNGAGDSWVECWDKNGAFRSISPERVKAVRRVSKQRGK